MGNDMGQCLATYKALQDLFGRVLAYELHRCLYLDAQSM